MARLRLFGPAREEAGVGAVDIRAPSVGALLDEAAERFGSGFARIVDTAQIWVNGDAAGRDHAVNEGDEVAVIPPVSGG